MTLAPAFRALILLTALTAPTAEAGLFLAFTPDPMRAGGVSPEGCYTEPGLALGMLSSSSGASTCHVGQFGAEESGLIVGQAPTHTVAAFSTDALSSGLSVGGRATLVVYHYVQSGTGSNAPGTDLAPSLDYQLREKRPAGHYQIITSGTAFVMPPGGGRGEVSFEVPAYTVSPGSRFEVLLLSPDAPEGRVFFGGAPLIADPSDGNTMYYASYADAGITLGTGNSGSGGGLSGIAGGGLPGTLLASLLGLGLVRRRAAGSRGDQPVVLTRRCQRPSRPQVAGRGAFAGVFAIEQSSAHDLGRKAMMRRAVPAALVLLAATGCQPSAPEMPVDGKAADARSWRDPQPDVAPPANQPTGAAFLARAAGDRLHAEGRGADQQANPDYMARTAPWLVDYVASAQTDDKILHDPYRIDWGQARGREQDVEFLNRYGATLRAKFWGPRLPFVDPLTGRSDPGPFPTLIFIPGAVPPGPDSAYNGFLDYEGQLQQLAEYGYVVLAVAPQGQGGSEYFTPPHAMCDPAGDWKRPQDLGLVEPGECAGQNGPTPAFTGEYAPLYNLVAGLDPLAESGASVLQARLEEEASSQFFIDFHDVNRTRFVFAALDAATWLLSDRNPWRARVDGDRLGIVGHSMGADAALVAGNGDPQHRFKAAVAWDGYGLPPDTVRPRIPTMFHKGEDQNVLGPYVEPPANRFAPPYRNYRRFVAEDRDAMLVALRGSTHSEWYYTPYALLNPVAPMFNASSLGGQVSHYYTLAWFDRWLKNGPHRDDARRRLVARDFDASADAASIGSGTYDPLTQQNVPYRLAGERVADHLSVFFLSQAHFDAVSCDDLQARCP